MPKTHSINLFLLFRCQSLYLPIREYYCNVTLLYRNRHTKKFSEDSDVEDINDTK